MHKVKVLFVGPPALARLLAHVFGSGSEFEITGRVGRVRDLASRAIGRPALSTDPGRCALIVANVKPVGTAIGPAIASIRKFDPSAKVILICPVREFLRSARQWGADACLDQEKLVFRLLPAARVLCRNSRKTERSANQFLTGLEARAAPFALPRRSPKT